MRTNEFSKMEMVIRGFGLNKKQEEVRKYFASPKELDLAVPLNALIKKKPKFSTHNLEIPNGVSGKYQLLGLDNLKMEQEQKINFFHFSIGFVYRDQEEISTIDLEEHQVKKVELGANEYRYVVLPVTLVPTHGVMVLDGKAHNGPVSYFLRHVICPHLDASDFSVAYGGELFERSRFKITPVPKQNFHEVLSKKLNRINEVGITIAKPGKLKMSTFTKQEVAESDTAIAELFAATLGKIFSVSSKKTVFEHLPIKRLKLSVQFDENAPLDKKTQMASGLTEFYEAYQDSIFMDESTLGYKDAHGELFRALLKGGVHSEENELHFKDHGNETKMWQEQRRVFFKLKGYI